jgi:hypothetical protein
VRIKGINTLGGIPAIWGVIVLVAVAFYKTTSISADQPTRASSSLTAQSSAMPKKVERQHQVGQERPQAEGAWRATATTEVKVAEAAIQKKAQTEQGAANAQAADEISDYEASDTLIHCVLAQAQLGQFFSYEGEKSAEAILRENCRDKYAAYIKACVAAGMAQDTCAKSALTASQVALKQFNK